MLLDSVDWSPLAEYFKVRGMGLNEEGRAETLSLLFLPVLSSFNYLY
ncbi:hypothetical protein KAW18_05365 [candidate division WOR-3 bacterium]|nr:hypothetical protein [candidate division WOR-3 bacterium]